MCSTTTLPCWPSKVTGLGELSHWLACSGGEMVAVVFMMERDMGSARRKRAPGVLRCVFE